MTESLPYAAVVVLAAMAMAWIGLDGLRDDRRRNLASEYENGYRDGWRDCRDDNPPKDFP